MSKPSVTQASKMQSSKVRMVLVTGMMLETKLMSATSKRANDKVKNKNISTAAQLTVYS